MPVDLKDIAVVGIAGKAGAGKDTLARALQTEMGGRGKQCRRMHMADIMKDACAVMFGWDRDMLQGISDRSREWRETPLKDGWEDRLDFKGTPFWDGSEQITPRKVLQWFGTDVMRNCVHEDFWLWVMERRIQQSCAYVVSCVIVPDIRFVNELCWIKGRQSSQHAGFRIKAVNLNQFGDGDTHVSENEASELEGVNWYDYTLHARSADEHQQHAIDIADRVCDIIPASSGGRTL